MGSTYNQTNFDACSAKDVKKQFTDFQEQECLAYGNDTYSGHLGIKNGLSIYSNKIFPSAEEAEEYLSDNSEKWDSAIAVQVKAKITGISKSYTRFDEKKTNLLNDLVSFKKRCYLDIKTAKSKTIGCKSCGSQISRKHLTSVDCPVCHKVDSFYSCTVFNRILAKEKKIKALKAPEKNTKRKVDGFYWLVGGWCSN